MPVKRGIINLAVNGNMLVATDAATGQPPADAGLQGEDGAIWLHIDIPAEWQDLTVRLKVIAINGAYDESLTPVNSMIDMPLRQGVTVPGTLTVSLQGSDDSGLRRTADPKSLMIKPAAVPANAIPSLLPLDFEALKEVVDTQVVHIITGSGGALVTKTDDTTVNINVTGAGGDMLQANYANGNVNNANTVDVSKSAKAAQSGSALETVIAAKMPTATYAAGTGSVNTNKVDHAIYADSAGTATTQTAGDNSTKIATTAYVDKFANGWTPASEIWTYASANTITVPTGAANRYQKGDRIKWTQTTVKYSVIIAVADTLLTIAINTDFVVANAAISLNYYSHELNPIGYPCWFNYTSTITGYSSNPTSIVDRFKVDGNLCTWEHRELIAGTSNAGSTTISLPITAATITNMSWNVPCVVTDNGVTQATPGAVSTASAVSVVTAYKTYDFTNMSSWTASGAKRLAMFILSYEI